VLFTLQGSYYAHSNPDKREKLGIKDIKKADAFSMLIVHNELYALKYFTHPKRTPMK